MKKKILAVLALLVTLSAGSVAAAGVRYLVFNMNEGGQQVVIALADQPVITTAAGTLKVTVGGAVKVETPLGNVKNYCFSETSTPTGISEALKDGVRLEEKNQSSTEASE